MNLQDIQEHIMHQTNNDADDLEDYTPHIGEYINEAYDRIVVVWDKKHVPSSEYPKMDSDDDEPNLPEWMHRYIADWATWLIYRNGNVQKQQRGRAYWQRFEDFLSYLSDNGGKDGFNEDGSIKTTRHFYNIPW